MKMKALSVFLLALMIAAVPAFAGQGKEYPSEPGLGVANWIIPQATRKSSFNISVFKGKHTVIQNASFKKESIPVFDSLEELKALENKPFIVYLKDRNEYLVIIEESEQLAAYRGPWTIDAQEIENLPLAFLKLWQTTGIAGFLRSADEVNHDMVLQQKITAMPAAAEQAKKHQSVGGWGNLVMILIGLLLLYLAIKKEFEPLLLIPIGFGAILCNIPFVAMAKGITFVGSMGASGAAGEIFYSLSDIQSGFIGLFYQGGVVSGIFPLIIFMGVGAMTDFGPLIANPKTLLLGAAAQLGIFVALIGALLLGAYVPGINFDLRDAASIGIIGGADGPTSIFVTSRLSPDLLGAIAVAAYSYMALVPIIQPPIMKALTTKKERMIKMEQLRHVTKTEKIFFPLVVLGLCILLLPDATPLLGALMFGNLAKETGVIDRLSDTMQNALLNIVTIFLGLSVGSKMSADKFLNLETLGILALGLVAFSFGTAGGVLLAKLMNMLSPKSPINPLIGSAGVSAVPMAARVSNKVGLEANPENYLLMHAMGPNVAGVIGSAVAAGVLLALVPVFGG